jgi:hypothetical protein
MSDTNIVDFNESVIDLQSKKTTKNNNKNKNKIENLKFIIGTDNNKIIFKFNDNNVNNINFVSENQKRITKKKKKIENFNIILSNDINKIIVDFYN